VGLPLQKSQRQAFHAQSDPVQPAFQEMQRHVGGHGHEEPGRGMFEWRPPVTKEFGFRLIANQKYEFFLR
jgi:hypothetical protein